MGLFISKNDDKLIKQLQLFCEKYSYKGTLATEGENMTDNPIGSVITVILQLDDRCLIFDSIYSMRIGREIKSDFEQLFDEAAVMLEQVYIKDQISDQNITQYKTFKYMYNLGVLSEFGIHVPQEYETSIIKFPQAQQIELAV